MKYESEAQVAGALRGGTYDTETMIFLCHCPKPLETRLEPERVKLLEPIP